MTLLERAEHLMGRIVADGVEGTSRRDTINELAGIANADLPEARRWAEAWQLLARAGLVCPEPGYPKDGDWWFATPRGKSSIDHDFEGSLRVALTSPI